MTEVPRLDHLSDYQKDYPGDKQIMWSKKAITRSILHYMILEALCSLGMLGSPIGAFVDFN